MPSRYQSRYGPFHTDRGDEPPPNLLLEGIAQFNRGEYFEQHETLEILWRAEADDVRYLYQGILLVGVGLLHLQRNNYHGAVAKLETGVRILRWFGPVCQGVDVEALIADATRARDAIVALGRDRLGEFDPSLTPIVQIVGFKNAVTAYQDLAEETSTTEKTEMAQRDTERK